MTTAGLQKGAQLIAHTPFAVIGGVGTTPRYIVLIKTLHDLPQSIGWWHLTIGKHKERGHIPAFNSITLIDRVQSIFQLCERSVVERSLKPTLGESVGVLAVVVCVIRADSVITAKQHFELVRRVEESTAFVDTIWFSVRWERLSGTVESNSVQQIDARSI